MDQSHSSMLNRYFKDFLPGYDFVIKDGKAISKTWIPRGEFFSFLKSTNAPDKIIDIFSKSLKANRITLHMVYDVIEKQYETIKTYEQEQYITEFLSVVMDPFIGKELKSQKELYIIAKSKVKAITSTFIKKLVLLYDIDQDVTMYFDNKTVLFLLEKYAKLVDGKTLQDLKSNDLDLSWVTDELYESWSNVKLNFLSFQELLESLSMYHKALFYDSCNKWAITPNKYSKVKERVVDAAILNLVTELQSKGFDVSVESKVKDIIALAVENNINLTDTISEKIKCYLNDTRDTNKDLINVILAKADGTIYPDLIDSYKNGENPIQVVKKILFRAERDKILDMELSHGEFKHSIEKTLASILQVYINPYLTKSNLTVSNLLEILKNESLEKPAYYSIKPRDVKQDIMKSIQEQNKKIDKELGCNKIDMSMLEKLKDKFKRTPKLNKNPAGINDFNHVRVNVSNFFKMTLPNRLPEDVYSNILNVNKLDDNIERRFVSNVLNLTSFEDYIKDRLTYEIVAPLKTQEDIRGLASKIVNQWNTKITEKYDIKRNSRKLQPTYYYEKLEQELYEDSLDDGKLNKSTYYDKVSFPIFLTLGNTFNWFKSLKSSEKYQILLHTINNRSFIAIDQNDPDVHISYIPEYTESSVNSARLIFRKKYLEPLLQGEILFNKNIYHIYSTLIEAPITQNHRSDEVTATVPNYNVKLSEMIDGKKLLLLMNGELYFENHLIRQDVDTLYVATKDKVLILQLKTGRYLFSYFSDIMTILPLSTNITEVELIDSIAIFTVDDQRYKFDEITHLHNHRKAHNVVKSVSEILSSQDSDLQIIKNLLHIKREFTVHELKDIHEKINTITYISSSDYYKKLTTILTPFFEFSETLNYFHVPMEIASININVPMDIVDQIDNLLYELFDIMNLISSHTFILDSFVQDVRNMLLSVRLNSVYKGQYMYKLPTSDSKYEPLESLLGQLKSILRGQTELTSYYGKPKRFYNLELNEYVHIMKTLEKFPDRYKIPFITFFKSINPTWFNSEKMNLLMTLNDEIEALEETSPASKNLAMKYEDRAQLMNDMNKDNNTMNWENVQKSTATKTEMRKKVKTYIEVISSILDVDEMELPNKKLTFISLVQKFINRVPSSEFLFKWTKNTFKITKYHFNNNSPINHLYKQLDRLITEKTDLPLSDLYHSDHGKPASTDIYKHTLGKFIEYVENINLTATPSSTIESIYFTATRTLLNDGKQKTENFKNRQYIEILKDIMDLYVSMGGHEFLNTLKPLKIHENQHVITDVQNKNVKPLLTLLNTSLQKGVALDSDIRKMIELKNTLTKISKQDYTIVSEMIDKFLAEQYVKSDYYSSLLRYVMKLRYKIARMKKK